MIFAREASAAVVLVTLTLSLQCAGMAAVIAWARPSFAPDVLRIRPIPSAMLMMRLNERFHWFARIRDSALGRVLSLACFPLWESVFYFSAASYATVGYGDVVLPWMWRTLVPWKASSVC